MVKKYEIFVRKVHKRCVQVAVVSRGFISPLPFSPLTHLRKGRRERQRIAEFLQIIHQMVSRKSSSNSSGIFCRTIHPGRYQPGKGCQSCPAARHRQAKQLMTAHITLITKFLLMSFLLLIISLVLFESMNFEQL